MFHLTKYLFYLIIAAVIVGLVWFLPKYSYVQKNPGYCVNLTEHLYYCGTESNIKEIFNSAVDTVQQQ